MLEKALELAPEKRSAFLNQACSADPSLRQEVDTLLASSDQVRSNFLEAPPLPVTLTPGSKLGDYEIVSLVGSGGMGEVYRARDTRLGREVAEGSFARLVHQQLTDWHGANSPAFIRLKPQRVIRCPGGGRQRTEEGFMG